MGELGGRAGIFPALAFSGVVSVVIGLAPAADREAEPAGARRRGAAAGLALDRGRALGADHPCGHGRISRIGLAATIGTIIAFNLGAATLIDRFGWFGFDQIAITWTRGLGLVLLGAGAALSLFKSG